MIINNNNTFLTQTEFFVNIINVTKPDVSADSSHLVILLINKGFFTIYCGRSQRITNKSNLYL